MSDKTKKKKTILEKTMEEEPLSLDVNFEVDEITYKKGIRRFKFSVGTTLKKTNRWYRVSLYFDTERYKSKIEANLNLIAVIKSDATLFDKSEGGDKDKATRIRKIKDENKETLLEMNKLQDACIEYEFTGEAEKVEYNKETLTLRIDKETLSFLNDKAEYFSHYKIILKPMV